MPVRWKSLLMSRSEKRAAADQRRLHQRPAFSRPKLHDASQRAAPSFAAPQTYAAADEAGKHLNPTGIGRAGEANPLRVEIACQIHGAGIPVVARHAQLGSTVQPLAIGVDVERRFLTTVACCIFLSALAVDGQTNADRSGELMLIQLKLLALDIDRLLLAAVRTIAYQTLAHNTGGNFNFVFSCREWLQILGDAWLRCIACLQIEGSQWDECDEPECECELRRATNRGGGADGCNQESD